MPTVVGNEIYNFKFEFYDVNNNYVPVYVTQSALFSGGTNFNNIILAISSSASGSLSGSIDYINHVSQSISGTMTVYSSSASSSISQSVYTSSVYTSASVYSLSSSVSNSLTIVSGGITLLSGSFLQFTQSYYSTSASFDSRISQSISSSASQSLYQVYSASQYLDTFIFTDQTGKINQPPTASSPGLYLGSTYLGYFSGSGTAGWKTYMDNQGDFYLTGSNDQFLAWNSSLGTLQVQGVINIQGGNAATTSSVTASVVSGSLATSNSLAPNIFTDVSGNIVRPPNVRVNYSNGLFLGSDHLGYYSGSDWKTYMDNTGQFYLTGSATNYLKWSGSVLTIAGAINIVGGQAATDISNTALSASRAADSASLSGSSALSAAARAAASASLSGSVDPVTQRVTKAVAPSGNGLYLGSTYMGFYSGSQFTTYMSSSGNFVLLGNGTDGLTWNAGTGVLTIAGAINITGGQAATDLSNTALSASRAADSASLSGSVDPLTQKITKATTPSGTGLYLGSDYMGYYSSSYWATYMANNGNFYLTGKGGDSLTWNATSGVLTIAGAINITGGNGATTTYANTAAARAADSASISGSSALNAASTAQSTADTAKLWASASGSTDPATQKVIKATAPSGTGLYLGSDYMGFYSGSYGWKTYMSNAGDFVLAGKGGDGLTWSAASGVLTINGSINLTGGNAQTQLSAVGTATGSLQSQLGNVGTATGSLQSQLGNVGTATGSLQSQLTAVGGASGSWVNPSSYNFGGGGFTLASVTPSGAGLYLGSNYLGYYDGGTWKSYMNSSGQFYLAGSSNNGLSWDGNSLSIDGNITARNGTFIGNISSTATISGGTLSGGTISGGSISIGSNFSVDTGGNMIASNASIAGAITAGNGSSIGGWTISNSQIYVPNAITLDATAKQISVADSSGIPRVILNQNSSLSSLAGGSGGSGTYGGGSGTNGTSFSETVTSFTANSGQSYVVSANINQSNAAFAISLRNSSYSYSGYYNTYIYVSNGTTTYTLFSYSKQITRQNSTYSNLGGINGQSGTISFTGDGSVWTISTYTYYQGPNTIDYSNYGLNSPAFTYSYAVDVSKTEIIPGGLQVVTTSTQYVQAPRAAGTALIVGGNFTATGTKSFRITHPLDNTKYLYHAAVESPKLDLIYRGTIDLVNGFADIDLDKISNMTSGTWIKLNRNPQFFLQNMNGWNRLKGEVSGSHLLIYCEDSSSIEKVSYMVVGERHDDDIKESFGTDNEGNLIMERNKSEDN